MPEGAAKTPVNELSRLLIESIEDFAIFALDPHGYIVTWNAGTLRLLGYQADEIIGCSFAVLYPSRGIVNEKPLRQLGIAELTGECEEDGWRIRKDGSRCWVNVVIRAMHDDERQLIGFAQIVRDAR